MIVRFTDSARFRATRVWAGLLAVSVLGLAGAGCDTSETHASLTERHAPAAPDGGQSPCKPAIPGPTPAWLGTCGNHIVTADGLPWKAHGVSMPDARGCGTCAFPGMGNAELQRRVDEAIQVWHAGVVRIVLNLLTEDEKNSRLVDPNDTYVADLKAVVAHAASENVYVELAVGRDTQLEAANGWPTGGGGGSFLWGKLAKAFANEPHVLFDLADEPNEQFPENLEAHIAVVQEIVGTIRTVEFNAARGGAHVIVVPGATNRARSLAYWKAHPLAGNPKDFRNLAYEAHPFAPSFAFEEDFGSAAATLPVVLGSFAPSPEMSLFDAETLIDTAESLEIPWIASAFQSCPDRGRAPLLSGDASCGVGAPLTPSSAWGALVKSRLAAAPR